MPGEVRRLQHIENLLPPLCCNASKQCTARPRHTHCYIQTAQTQHMHSTCTCRICTRHSMRLPLTAGPMPMPQVDLVYQRCTAVNLQSRAKDFNTGKATSGASLTPTLSLTLALTLTLTLTHPHLHPHPPSPSPSPSPQRRDRRHRLTGCLHTLSLALTLTLPSSHQARASTARSTPTTRTAPSTSPPLSVASPMIAMDWSPARKR